MMGRQTSQKEMIPGAQRALHGSEKEPRSRRSRLPELKMAPREESWADETSITGIEEGERRGGFQPGDRPEGRGKAMSEWKDGGEPTEKHGRMKRLHAATKMAPGPAAMQIPKQKGESFRGMLREELWGIKMRFPRVYGRSKSLPPHLGLQKFKTKDGSNGRQRQPCDNSVKRGQQEESHKATHPPPIPQLDEEGGWAPEGYDKSSDLARKACKNVKRTGHILQRKETLRNENQVQQAAPTGAKEPQRDKISLTSPRSAKKENIRGPGTTPPSPNGIQPSRPNNWPIKETKMSEQGRGKRPASQYCPSRPLHTCANTTGTGPPRRHQVNLPSTGNDTENNETLLQYMERPNSCEGHKWAFGQKLIMAVSLEINRGTWPPEMSLLSREDTRPLELFDSYSNRREA